MGNAPESQMSSQSWAFESLYFQDRLGLINPLGDVGVVTLWTPQEAALRQLSALQIDLSPDSARIAVVANLYGDGLPQLIRNLLWNPQIHYVLIYGQDLSHSGVELANLLIKGVEPAQRLGQERYRILGTNRLIDTGFPPEALVGNRTVCHLGKPGKETFAAITQFFQDLPSQQPPQQERLNAPLPTYKPSFYPSEPAGHVIVQPRPLEAWEEVVCRLMRYGIPTIASKTKERLELQHLKVVITDPQEESQDALSLYGYDLKDLKDYQGNILSPELPEDLYYSYGNRLRGYWPFAQSAALLSEASRLSVSKDAGILDSLEAAAQILAQDETSRGAYISLWDTGWDLDPEEQRSKPCLVTLFFRVFQGKVTMSATFRAHNTMSAWLRNVYGLMAIQSAVVEKMANLTENPLPIGALTVISHSISIDPKDIGGIETAQQIQQARKDDLLLDRETGKRELREDPMGYFVFTVDHQAGEIIADLKYGGETLQRYRGQRAQDIEKQIARDQSISLLSHALYVGRQLTIMEADLKAAGAKRA